MYTRQMSNTLNTAEVVVANLATKAGYGATAATGFMAWIGTNHFAVISSFLIAFLAFLISTYLKLEERKERKKRHELDILEREARIAHLNRNRDVPENIPVEPDSTF